MNSEIRDFQRKVKRHYQQKGRHTLPWRKTKDPYRILVSEVMLQQTQVTRVIPFYRAFLKRFPTVRLLADAPLSDVVRLWQGLGYNRRAKMLHQAAKRVVIEHKGKVPSSYDELITLPGVGDYTAKAILVFAYNRSEVMIETNIRAAYLHAFFPKGKRVSDRRLLPYIRQSLDRIHPREWYWALMDYGSHIKSLYPNPSQRSAHHVKQKPFKGSEREVRGAIIRELSKEKTPVSDFASLGFKKSRVQDAIKRLMNEGLIEVRPEEGYVLSS